MLVDVTLNINGKPHSLSVNPTEMLVDVLRDRLGYIGANKVCAQGICGACTVIVNCKSVTSCLTLAVQVDGEEISTVEGMQIDGELHPLQEAFMRHGAVQCGYCTSGFLMTAQAFLEENPDPSRKQIVNELRGNICRCTGYKKIIDAVADAAKQMRSP
ncbi:MAG: (2Fe-2S)-binding protein [Pseudomonadota bacterium]|nr:(2Fe-2S)-binding protein [Pseudomonadota bacterium]